MNFLYRFMGLHKARQLMKTKTYSITVNVTNGTYVGAEEITTRETAQISITPSDGYINPETITVVGADYTWDAHSGAIELSNPTDEVIITVACEVEPLPTPESLEQASWADIKRLSDAGQGANYFSIGDTKSIVLNGTVGTLELNNYTTYIYIIDFNHNSAVEGTGISFGGFKTAGTSGDDVALCDSYYNSSLFDGTKWFNMNHSGSINTGGWKSCDLRYDILGSVEVKDQQNATSAAVTDPVINTLMAALPSELRAVLKPVTKYTDNIGGGSGSVEANVTSTVDYLFLLAEKEIFGSISYANTNEGSHQSQYSYYISASKIKYNHSSISSRGVNWWERSPSASDHDYFCRVSYDGRSLNNSAVTSYGLSPAFVV